MDQETKEMEESKFKENDRLVKIELRVKKELILVVQLNDEFFGFAIKIMSETIHEL
jgi:hypothetical protein